MGHPVKDYDDDLLIADLAEGQLTYAQIGRRHGLSASQVGKIARGVHRPELQAEILAAAAGVREQAQRLGATLARTAWARLGRLVSAADVADEIQRKAAVDILKMADHAAPPPAPPGKGQTGPDLTGLSDETRRRILAELGGPDS
ncbi:MAG: hypothetical protein ACOC7R_00170 [Planctomycetota bacterium]